MTTSHWISKDQFKLKKESIKKNSYRWLALPNNLTETIIKTGACFSLNLLSQAFEKPYHDEMSAFHDYPVDASYALIRKVFLEGNKTPWIFARVIIPEQTYWNYQHEINRLGHAPIGNTLLYHNPQVTRKDFEYKHMNADDEVFHELKKRDSTLILKDLWARRSLFLMPKGSLLITEIFLDNLGPYPLGV
jgi:chorismate-pyruvate lyase